MAFVVCKCHTYLSTKFSIVFQYIACHLQMFLCFFYFFNHQMNIISFNLIWKKYNNSNVFIIITYSWIKLTWSSEIMKSSFSSPGNFLKTDWDILLIGITASLYIQCRGCYSMAGWRWSLVVEYHVDMDVSICHQILVYKTAYLFLKGKKKCWYRNDYITIFVAHSNLAMAAYYYVIMVLQCPHLA